MQPNVSRADLGTYYIDFQTLVGAAKLDTYSFTFKFALSSYTIL